MNNEFRKRALKLLSDIDQQISDVEEFTVEASDDEVLHRTSALLPDMRLARERVEQMLR